MYRIFYTQSASKHWKKIPSSLVAHLSKAIENLAQNPRPSQCEKLSGTQNAYRLRKGDYRILYTIEDNKKEVIVYRIAHRREVYR